MKIVEKNRENSQDWHIWAERGNEKKERSQQFKSIAVKLDRATFCRPTAAFCQFIALHPNVFLFINMCIRNLTRKKTKNILSNIFIKLM